MTDEINRNLSEVHVKIKTAAKKADRNPDDIHLIAVSKTKPVQDILTAYGAGIRDFGENKVQEMTEKQEILPKDIRWHMIGHLQTNKVKYLIDQVYMIHSVDSFHLAKEISKEAVKKNRNIPILLEVNVAEEATKYGFRVQELENAVRQISLLPAIQIEGLMTIAPYVQNQEENRVYFSTLKHLSVDISQKNIDNVHMNILSMGMTGDYETAIEEGATFVRVGTGIFGNRDYINL